MALQPHVDTAARAPQVRPVLSGAHAACAALAASSPERVWNLTDDEVTDAMRMLGTLSASVDAHLVTVLAEAKRRGLGTGDGWGPVDWARATAPGLDTRKLLDVDTVADAAATGELRLGGVVQAVLDAGNPHAEDAALEALPMGKAAQIVRFHKGVRGLAEATDLEGATAILVESARGTGGLVERDLATLIRHTGNLLRPDRLVERDGDLKRAHRSLVKSAGPGGMSRYTGLLDDEGAAIVDAAVDARAKPRPDSETGERDPRSAAARRADALVELVQRAVSAPDGVPRQAKTSLVLTIGLEVLEGACRGAGLTMAGQVHHRHGAPARLRRTADPGGPGLQGGGPRPGHGGPVVRPGPGPAPVDARPALHVSPPETTGPVACSRVAETEQLECGRGARARRPGEVGCGRRQ